MKKILSLGFLLTIFFFSACKKNTPASLTDASSIASDNAALISLAESYGFHPVTGPIDPAVLALKPVTLASFKEQISRQSILYKTRTRKSTTSELAGETDAYTFMGLPNNQAISTDPNVAYSSSILWSYFLEGQTTDGFPDLFNVLFDPPTAASGFGEVAGSAFYSFTPDPVISWSYTHLSGTVSTSFPINVGVLGRLKETENFGTGTPLVAYWDVRAGCTQTEAGIQVTAE